MGCCRHSLLTTMPLNTLYADVFYTVLDWLELDDIARLSGANCDVHTMCTEYVPMVSEFTLDSLQCRRCNHKELLPSVPTTTGYITPIPEQCTAVDKSSVNHGYCGWHLERHTCWDCGTVREELDKEGACAHDECCYKWVCRLEDGGCVSLQCWSCHAYHDVIDMYKYCGVEKDLLCYACVQEHDVADTFVSCVTWYGLRLEELERRYG